MLSCLDSTYHQSVRYLQTQGLFTCFELDFYSKSGFQKLKYQDLLHMLRQNLGIGLVERLNLSAIFSELKSLTLLSTTLEDPYSL